MPEGSSPTPTQPCPSCGIAVMIGYLKCPKCHAPMPGAGASSQRMKRASIAGGGGTTSEPVPLDPVSSGGPLLWIVAVLVLAAGLAVWATQCRTGKKRNAPSAAVVDENAPAAGTGATAPNRDEPLVAPRPSTGPDPSYTADTLEGELAGERLYATVQVFGEVLDVRSAFCNEARLGEIIGRHAAELKDAGVQRVRCSETYGTQVFERGL